MKPIIEISNISKKFRIRHDAQPYLSLRESITSVMKRSRQKHEEFYALKDVSFSLMPGESLGIIGKNGAGKSTLLKILSRITPPSQGRVITRGRMASLLEVGTGFHPELTGKENIFLNGSILGMRKQEINRHFDAIVDFAGTGKFLDTPLKHYSSGMQLRLAFSVAAFLEPEILVLDEVLAVGDSEFQKKCFGKMEDISKSGRTILFVSHNMSAVKALCGKAILLGGGQKLIEGTPSEVISRYLTIEKSATERHTYTLSPGILITDMKLHHTWEGNKQHLNYSFNLESATENQVSGLALLIYNSLNERIGILDLRHSELFEASSSAGKIAFSGTISDLPLVEGEYQIGIYILSNQCRGDFYNLAGFEVMPRPNELVPYDLSYRGYVEFDHRFKIRKV